jgi:predicted dehydrogenase
MYNVAVIGIGSLGLRHFQALLGCTENINLYAVDNSQNSMDKARDLANSSEGKLVNNIVITSNLRDLPENLDMVVIATSSNVRAAIIKELLLQSTIKYLILEKVLFQCINDYYEIEELLNSSNVKTWVNCSRRMMSGHKKIKELLAGEHISNVVIHGGSWGLGCNSIHMLDLISFIIDEFSSLTCNGQMLDKNVINSKREGFIEFTGSLTGKLNDSISYVITSSADSNEPITMYFLGENLRVIIKENLRIAYLVKGDDIECIEVPIMYQSQMTNIVAEQLLRTGDCELTPFSVSCRLHIPMLQTFIKHQMKYWDGGEERCMIT